MWRAESIKRTHKQTNHAQVIDSHYLMKIKATFLFLTALSVASAGRLQHEKHYQKLYAEQVGGQVEVTAPDGTRCDILTETHAIEADFADKRVRTSPKGLTCLLARGHRLDNVSSLP